MYIAGFKNVSKLEDAILSEALKFPPVNNAGLKKSMTDAMSAMIYAASLYFSGMNENDPDVPVLCLAFTLDMSSTPKNRLPNTLLHIRQFYIQNWLEIHC